MLAEVHALSFSSRCRCLLLVLAGCLLRNIPQLPQDAQSKAPVHPQWFGVWKLYLCEAREDMPHGYSKGNGTNDNARQCPHFSASNKQRNSLVHPNVCG